MAMRDSLKNKSVLTYSFSDGNGQIEMRWDSYDAVERRHTYHMTIRPDSQTVYESDDLRSGSGDPVSLPRMLACVLTFLGAFSESRRYGNPSSENWNLFPNSLAPWAEAMADEFTMAAEAIEPFE